MGSQQIVRIQISLKMDVGLNLATLKQQSITPNQPELERAVKTD